MKIINLLIISNLYFSIFAMEQISHKNNQEANLEFVSSIKQENINKFNAILSNQNLDINFENESGHTFLMYAIWVNNLEMVKSLVKAGVDLNAQNKKGNTALMLAVLHDLTDMVNFLLTEKADLSLKNNQNKTALDIAIEDKNLEIIKIFLLNKFNLNDKNKNGDNALVLAIKKDKFELVSILLKNFKSKSQEVLFLFNGAFKLLLEEIVNLSMQQDKLYLNSEQSQYIYLEALKNSDLNLIKLLNDKKIVVNLKKNNLANLLLDLALKENDYNLFNKCLVNNININVVGTLQNNLLMFIASKIYKEMIKLLDLNYDTANKVKQLPEDFFLNLAQTLMQSGIDVNAINQTGETALIHACESSFIKLVHLLLECKANVNNKNKNCDTALLFACKNKQNDLVKLLLENNADVNAENNNSARALTVAVASKNDALIWFLLENKNIDLNFKHPGHPLIYAISHENVELANKLLEKKANPDMVTLFYEIADLQQLKNVTLDDKFCYKIKSTGNISKENFKEQKLLHFAVDQDNVELINLLLKYGATVDSKDSYGRTPLICAAQLGRLKCVETLLKHGANTDIGSNYKKTAAQMAAENGHAEVVKMIIEHKMNLKAETS